MDILISVLLVLFIILGTFDGLYFHLFKYRLHLLPSARREHVIHTARAFVFVPIAIMLFVVNSAGWLLWLSMALVLFDAYLELIDILEERRSRAPLGGITSEESAIHVFASSFKFGAILLLYTTKVASSYALTSPLILDAPMAQPLAIIGFAFALGSFLGGVYSLFPDFKIRVCSRVCPPKATDFFGVNEKLKTE